MRAEMVENGLKFLRHPNVQNTPLSERVSFLEQKGMTKEEIQEAIERYQSEPEPLAATAPVMPVAQAVATAAPMVAAAAAPVQQLMQRGSRRLPTYVRVLLTISSVVGAATILGFLWNYMVHAGYFPWFNPSRRMLEAAKAEEEEQEGAQADKATDAALLTSLEGVSSAIASQTEELSRLCAAIDTKEDELTQNRNTTAQISSTIAEQTTLQAIAELKAEVSTLKALLVANANGTATTSNASAVSLDAASIVASPAVAGTSSVAPPAVVAAAPVAAKDTAAQRMKTALKKFRQENSTEQLKLASGILIMYVKNLVENPDVPRYRRIAPANANFKQKIEPLKHHDELLKSIGFESTGLNMEWRWHLLDRATGEFDEHLAVLRALLTALQAVANARSSDPLALEEIAQQSLDALYAQREASKADEIEDAAATAATAATTTTTTTQRVVEQKFTTATAASKTDTDLQSFLTRLEQKTAKSLEEKVSVMAAAAEVNTASATVDAAATPAPASVGDEEEKAPVPVAAEANETTGEPPYPKSFTEVMEMIKKGEPVPGIQQIEERVSDDSAKFLTEASDETVAAAGAAPRVAALPAKPWEKRSRSRTSLAAVLATTATAIEARAAATTLSVSTRATTECVGQHFEVSLETKAGGGARLAIYTQGKAKKLWASEYGRAFVGVGISPPDLNHSYYGYAVANPGFTVESTNQSIQSVTRSATGSVVISGSVSLGANASVATIVPYSIELAETSTPALSLRVDVDAAISQAAGVNRLVLEYAADEGEEFFGFGQQFPLQLNQKGSRMPILVNEQGAGRGLEPLTTILNVYNQHAGGDIRQTYAPMPHYQTSKLRQLFLENSEFAVFDLTKNTTTRVELAATSLKAQLSVGDSPLDLIEVFTTANGRQRRLPKWLNNGAIVGTQGGRAFVEGVYAKLKAVDAPIAAFWLQDWVGNRVAPWGTALWWNWEVDEVHYPNWTQFVSSFRNDSVRMLTYLNPHAGDIKGVKTDPAPKRYLYEELIDNGFAVMNSSGLPQLSYQNTAIVDLTNPKAREWVKQLIKTNVLANGVSGYMCDFGEALELDSVVHSGDAAVFHNQYPEVWARVNAEAVAEMGLQDEVLFFMRSGFTRSPQYTPLYWLGDQLQSWDEYDGFKNAVFAATVGGFSGVALTHPDIGGYNYLNSTGLPAVYKRTKELFLRWAEFAAFTAAYRTHDGSSKENAWQFYSDDETLALFARNAKIYVAWGFYRDALLDEVATKGYPLLRHLYLHYPDDMAARTAKYQFLVGSQLLVAPVVDEGASEVTLYLPEGDWVHVWTDAVFRGAQNVTVAAPLGQTAVFYPRGSSVGEQFVANLQAAKLRN